MRTNSRNRFTVFDMMEAKGVFSANPANSDSVDPTEGTSLYVGPVAYPKMMYHPEGLERVIVPAQAVVNPVTGEAVLDRAGNPISRGEQREIVWELAHSKADEKRLAGEGWHDHPAR